VCHYAHQLPATPQLASVYIHRRFRRLRNSLNLYLGSVALPGYPGARMSDLGSLQGLIPVYQFPRGCLCLQRDCWFVSPRIEQLNDGLIRQCRTPVLSQSSLPQILGSSARKDSKTAWSTATAALFVISIHPQFEYTKTHLSVLLYPAMKKNLAGHYTSHSSPKEYMPAG
jgi:hypothetical protein